MATEHNKQKLASYGDTSFVFDDIFLDSLKKVGSKGDTTVQLRLGAIYTTGYGVELDAVEGVSWYKLGHSCIFAADRPHRMRYELICKELGFYFSNYRLQA